MIYDNIVINKDIKSHKDHLLSEKKKKKGNY